MGPRARLPRFEPGDRPHRFGGPDDETGRSLEHPKVANRYLGGTRSVLRPLCHLLDDVTSSMRLHDVAPVEAAGLLRSWRRLATRAVVVADVQRHWIPCAAISLLGRLSKNPLLREGHGHTVRRGFTPGELGHLGGQAGFVRVRVRRHVPFRLSLVGLL